MDDNIDFTRSLAVATIEEYSKGAESSKNEKLQAWGYLIKTGDVWNLEKRYGRTAARYIEESIISEEGILNWELIEEINKSF